jgi:hypothetical protein
MRATAFCHTTTTTDAQRSKARLGVVRRNAGCRKGQVTLDHPVSRRDFVLDRRHVFSHVAIIVVVDLFLRRSVSAGPLVLLDVACVARSRAKERNKNHNRRVAGGAPQRAAMGGMGRHYFVGETIHPFIRHAAAVAEWGGETNLKQMAEQQPNGARTRESLPPPASPACTMILPRTNEIKKE